MNYPFWEVPYIGSQLVIAIVAITHVFISHFAVGGGFYLPIAEKTFRKYQNPNYLDFLKRFTRFFVIVTVIFGAISGVGIWISIGLINPETTTTLLRTFVFAWAIEWVSFLVEIIAVLFYYYTFSFLSAKNHLRIGWIYMVTAWMSLFIINGILTFMLTPSDWVQSKNFWNAFFNPTFLPSLLTRTFATVMMVCFWSIFVASRLKDLDLKENIIRFNTRFIIPVVFGMVGSLVWYYFMLPEQNQIIAGLGFSNIGPGNFSLVTRLVTIGFITFVLALLFIVFGPLTNARNLRPFMAVLLLVMGFLMVGSFEFSREMLRKPFAVTGYIYSNSTRVAEEEQIEKDGVLAHIRWNTVKTVTPENKIEAGHQIFRNQCQACHTKERGGYRSLVDLNLAAERDKVGIRGFIDMIKERDPEKNMYIKFMPRFLGNRDEADALTEYIYSLMKPYVKNPEVAAEASVETVSATK